MHLDSTVILVCRFYSTISELRYLNKTMNAIVHHTFFISQDLLIFNTIYMNDDGTTKQIENINLVQVTGVFIEESL